MTDWKRVFQNIWTHIKWLNSYGNINEVALLKILKKFKKNFFTFAQRNVDIDHQIQVRYLQEYIQTRCFKVSSTIVSNDLRTLMTDLKCFYAEVFCKGDVREASLELNELHNKLRRVDLSLITYFGGMTSVMALVLTFFIIIAPRDGKDDWDEIFSNVETFILTGVIVFIMFAAGFNVMIFRRYSVNYQFIFELDHNYKLIHHQFYALAMILLTIWISCLTFQVAYIKFVDNDLAVFTLICILSFIVICCQPFHCFYMRARKQVLKTLWQIVISPFGIVRFRHFFLADVVTSMIGPT
jgi:hypothetical protein